MRKNYIKYTHNIYEIKKYHFHIGFWHVRKEFSIENGIHRIFHIEASEYNKEWRICMENDVVKFLKEKGKSEEFISLILKIIKCNCANTNEVFDILKSML